MGGKNKDYRKHISAAKEWLGQAEESMEQNNDIRSDLKLMLAQAELARAKEKDDVALWKKWLKWTVPWAAAMAIAVGYVFFLRPDLLEEKDVDLPETASINQNVTEAPAAAKVESTVEPALTEKNPSAAVQNDELANISQDVPQEAGIQTVPEKDYSRETIPVEKRESSILDEDMQRLMQKAGQSLRE